jgi:hypothetical protein
MQTGFREANAKVARERFQLARRRAFLDEKQERILLTLQRSYRDLIQLREEMQIRRSAREAAALQLEVRTRKFEEGFTTLDVLLDSQRAWADALRSEFVAICNYNIVMADYERQKGSILQYHHVAIAEGPLSPDFHPAASDFLRHRAMVVCHREPAAEPSTAELPDSRPQSVAELLERNADLPPSLSER